MRFLIDVDGVVADLMGRILDELGKQIPPEKMISKEDMSNYRFEDNFPEDQYELIMKSLREPGFGRDLPLIDGAVEGTRKIEQAGHDIYWVTAPNLQSPTWEYDRRIFLKEYFDTDPYRIIFAHDKFVVEGDVFIDDRADNVKNWISEQKGTGLIYTQPWNKSIDIDRFTWKDIDLLLKMVE